MKGVLLLAGVGVVAAFSAGWWFARRIGEVKPMEATAPSAAIPSAALSGTSPDTGLSDAEIDALPPELPAAPARRRGRPAIPSVRV